jgi:hypothetical protein
MKVLVTGANGFVGRHLLPVLTTRGHELVYEEQHPNALIHLAWENLHDYENPQQMANVGWQVKLIEQLGIKNVVVAGTIWETSHNLPPYVLAKQAIHEQLLKLPIVLKWVRAPYIYGEGQRETALLPGLHQAVAAGVHEFRVVPGKLPFLPVETFCERLVDAMENEQAHTANIPGAWENVADFCRRHLPDDYEMEFIADYPPRPWEK